MLSVHIAIGQGTQGEQRVQRVLPPNALFFCDNMLVHVYDFKQFICWFTFVCTWIPLWCKVVLQCLGLTAVILPIL